MASLIDTLVVAFTGDSTALKKSAGDAEKVIQKTKNTVIDAEKAIKTLGKSLLDTIKSARGTIAGLLSIGAITKSVITQASSTAALGDFSKAIGANIEEVDAWGKAVAREGGSAEGFQGSIKSLTDSLTELTLTGSGPAAEAFARLGIQAVDAGGNIKSAFDLLPEIADSFEDLSEVEAMALGQQLGLDQATILLLQRGRTEIDQQIRKQKELGVTTEEDAERAREFRDAMQNLQNVFKSLTRNVGAFLLPAFTSILQGLEKVIGFLRDNSVFVSGFFVGAAAAIIKYYHKAIIKAAIATAKFAITAAIAAGPFLVMAAVVTAVGVAIGLLVDDIIAFANGAPSVIGVIRDWFVKGFGAIGEAIDNAWNTIKEFFAFITGGFLEGITNAFSKIAGYIRKIPFLGKDADAITAEAVQKAEIAIHEAENNPLIGHGTNSIAGTNNSVSKNTTVLVDDININAQGANSEEISANIADALRDELSATVSNYDDTVMI